MINFEIYMTNIPKQESIIQVLEDKKTDTYVFCAPETLE